MSGLRDCDVEERGQVTGPDLLYQYLERRVGRRPAGRAGDAEPAQHTVERQP